MLNSSSMCRVFRSWLFMTLHKSLCLLAVFLTLPTLPGPRSTKPIRKMEHCFPLFVLHLTCPAQVKFSKPPSSLYLRNINYLLRILNIIVLFVTISSFLSSLLFLGMISLVDVTNDFLNVFHFEFIVVFRLYLFFTSSMYILFATWVQGEFSEWG